MRFTVSLYFLILIAVLCLCSASANRSPKEIGKAVAWLEAATALPVLGNLIMNVSEHLLLSNIGFYTYFLGMDVLMYALINFSVKYCKGTGGGRKVPKLIYGLLIADAVQLFMNPFFGHAFGYQEKLIEGSKYFVFVPKFGLTFHRFVNYLILFCVMLILTIIVIRMPRIYRERYSVILFALVVGGLWQFYDILSHPEVNRSVIGIAMCSMIIFYFALCYKPMRLLDRMLSDIVSEMSEAMFMFDPVGKCVWANEQGCKMTECGTNFDKAFARLTELFGELNIGTKRWVIQKTTGTGADLRYYTIEENLIYDDRKRLSGSYLSIRDTTEEKKRVEQEIYYANHDRLTGLYTKEYLFKNISEKLNEDNSTEYYIVFVDVKNFKIVNDMFGTTFGDYALKCIADWIRKGMTGKCVYGRLVGDTFGVLIPAEEFDTKRLEEDLAHFVVRMGSASYQLLIHLGVYTVDRSDRDINVMFERAHLSLGQIRDEYNTHIAYYNTEIREKILWDQNISARLDEALLKREIRPYLQPIADETGNIIGAEALARWIHPSMGFLSPASFVPVFEKNGMIIEIDRYMWRCACEILAGWSGDREDMFISINISPKDFYYMDITDELARLVSEFGIAPERLRIEITETVMMNDSDNRMQMLEDLRQNGFIVEMDDFGSGYSSLNLLKDMPVDVLKIDMKFLDKSSDKQKARTIVKNIINLSEELGITSLTEGVETEEQFRILSGMGCRMFQGYYFAKPMPTEDFEQLLTEKK